MKEFKHFAFDLKAQDDAARTVEGFGSVFNNEDSYGDIVLPGAFVESLKARKPAMLWQHNSDQPIGVWDTFEEREEGLFLKGRIFDTTLGEDAYKLVKGGAISGLSIGFATRKDEYDEDQKIRKLLELELYEVSLVTFPANDKATITNVKEAPANERDLEKLLRDAGFSRREARAIVADGFKAIAPQRDAEEQTLTHLTNLFNQFNA